MLMTPEKMFERAMAKKYIIGAFNVFNQDSATAVALAAEEERSPVIMQVSMGARRYQPDWVGFVAWLKDFAAKMKADAFIQHDHLDSVQACMDAVDAGVDSVMFDGSHLPYEQNVAKTKEVVAYAHKRGVRVEAELGCLPGFEDMIFAEKAVFTDPAMAAQFVKETGCNSLAVSVGTSHGGVRAAAPLKIDFAVLEAIHQALPAFPLVLHGAASLPKELIDNVNAEGGHVEYLKNAAEPDIERCRLYGVAKANMDVDNFLVYTAKVRELLNQQPQSYDPRKYLLAARLAMQSEVQRKMRHVLKSAGALERQEIL